MVAARFTVLLAACALLGLGAGLARAQPFSPAAALYRACSIGNVPTHAEARYAAATGLLSTDAERRKSLLPAMSRPGGSADCALATAQHFCTKAYFDLAVTALTNSMRAGGTGEDFFFVLSKEAEVEEPGANAGAIVDTVLGGVTGGIVGLNLGGDHPVLGALAGGYGGSKLGGAAGAVADKSLPYARCVGLQRKFGALTEPLVRQGLVADTSDRGLARQIEGLPQRSGRTTGRWRARCSAPSRCTRPRWRPTARGVAAFAQAAGRPPLRGQLRGGRSLRLRRDGRRILALRAEA